MARDLVPANHSFHQLVRQFAGLSRGELDNLILGRMSRLANIRAEIRRLLLEAKLASEDIAAARVLQSAERGEVLAALPPTKTGDGDDPLTWARNEIRDQQRTAEELVPSIPEGYASTHRRAARTYQQRNLEAGLCERCPQPLAPRSKRYCEKHLAAARERKARQ